MGQGTQLQPLPTGIVTGGPAWDELETNPYTQGDRIDKYFLKKYFQYISYFGGIDDLSEDFMNKPRMTKDSAGNLKLNALGIASALEVELVTRPAWMMNKLNSLDPNERKAFLANHCPIVRSSADKDLHMCIISGLTKTLKHASADGKQLGFDLNSAVITAKLLGLVPPDFDPQVSEIKADYNLRDTKYASLTSMILDQWMTEKKQKAIMYGIDLYIKTINYWKSNNLDAFATHNGVKIRSR